VRSKDLLTVPEAGILEAAPVYTIVGGMVVFRSEAPPTR